jgi:hypothetical protein
MSGVKTIGIHRVKNSDVYLGIDDLMNGQAADICYSDPPWGTGTLKYWGKINQKMNDTISEPICTDVEQFLDKVLSIAKKHTKGFVVIEYGIKWQDRVIFYAQKNGLHYCTKVQTLYDSRAKKLPLINLFFHTEEKKKIDVSKLNNLAGYQVVYETFKLLNASLSCKKVLDFCCGMGYTAQASIDNNLQFFENELNKKRLDKTIDRLTKNKKSKYAK